MRLFRWAVAVLVGVVLLPSQSHARDVGVFIPSIHAGKWTSSVLYEDLKVQEDFDTRGKADFKSQVVGTQFSYGISDQIALAVKGGVLVNPEEDAQGAEWHGRAGYLYGIDLYNEVFPATGVWPGVQVGAGVTGFQVPLTQSNATVVPGLNGLPSTLATGPYSPIDQNMSGVDYHTQVVLTMKVNRCTPYTGVRLFGRSVNWRDNQSAAAADQPANIVGHAHGNASVIIGLPIRITQDVNFQAEAVLLNETALTAGFTIAAF